MRQPRYSLHYRPDIDGLRAVAVVAVILFHAHVPGFEGGYIGVDVFFVISGYLITMLLTERRDGRSRMRLTEFYLRRARRILPALLVMLALTAIVATVLLFPIDLARFGKFLAAATVLLSNLASWAEGHYFAGGLPNVGLMHLWSISVEEQFYLVFPLLLVLIENTLPKRRLATLVGLLVLSLVLCVWASYARPAANFFLAPTRAWELLLGGVAALGTARWIDSRPANEFLAAASLAVLAFTIYRLAADAPYPGDLTLIPTIATAVLILIGRDQATLTSKLLSVRPLVFTGLISYSLYLWHLPILAFFNYYNIAPPTFLQLSALLVAIYAAAFVSWKVIEQPIRRAVFLGSTRVFVTSVAALNIVLLIAGVLFWRSIGFPARFPADIRALVQSGGEITTECEDIPIARVRAGDLCRYGSNDAHSPKVVVWGDSHVSALLPAYHDIAETQNLQLFVATHSACRPVLDRDNQLGQRPICMEFNSAARDAIRKLDPDLVILNAHWNEPGSDRSSGADANRTYDSELASALDATLLEIAEHRVSCIVLDVPTMNRRPAHALAMARRRGIDEGFIGVTRAEALQRVRGIDDRVRLFAQRPNVIVVDPKEILCKSEACVFESDGKSLYFDDNHLSITGARFVAPALQRCFDDISTNRERLK